MKTARVTVPRHAFKTAWNWNIAVGQGRRFGADMNTVLNAIVGGWEFHGSGRFQNQLIDFGNVRLVGMTADPGLRQRRRLHPGQGRGLPPADESRGAAAPVR